MKCTYVSENSSLVTIGCSTDSEKVQKLTKSTPATIPSQKESTSGEHTTLPRTKYNCKDIKKFRGQGKKKQIYTEMIADIHYHRVGRL